MRNTSVFLAIVVAIAAGAVHAEDYKLGTLQVRQPWARATPKGASVGGGYMTITNSGTQPDRLIGGSVDVAGRFEIHQMTMNQGVMQMRPLQQGLEIKAGETVELKPGSFHVMFLNIRQPLTPAQRVKGTLVFEKAGKLDIEYQVVPIGAVPQPAHSGH